MLLALPAAADLNAGNLTAKEFRGFCRDDNVIRCREVVTGVYLGLLRGAAAFTMDEQKLNRGLLGCFPDETPTDELAVRVTQFFRDTEEPIALRRSTRLRRQRGAIGDVSP
ncbi:MAG: hypothetical protein ACKVOI_02690 [Dongiaceae bacterium]